MSTSNPCPNNQLAALEWIEQKADTLARWLPFWCEHNKQRAIEYDDFQTCGPTDAALKRKYPKYQMLSRDQVLDILYRDIQAGLPEETRLIELVDALFRAVLKWMPDCADVESKDLFASGQRAAGNLDEATSWWKEISLAAQKRRRAPPTTPAAIADAPAMPAVTIEDAAHLLEVADVSHIHRLCRQGKLTRAGDGVSFQSVKEYQNNRRPRPATADEMGEAAVSNDQKRVETAAARGARKWECTGEGSKAPCGWAGDEPASGSCPHCGANVSPKTATRTKNAQRQ